MSLETEIANLTEQASKLCQTFENKIGEIDAKVAEATEAVPDAIKNAFLQKTVNVDPVNGSDNLSTNGGVFKTIKAAVESVPNGAAIIIQLKYGPEQHYYDFTDGHVEVHNRRVRIYGAPAVGAVSDNKPCIIRCKTVLDSVNTRTQAAGRFNLTAGGSLELRYVGIELPRLISGTSIEPGVNGAVVTGSGLFAMFTSSAYPGNKVYTVAGTAPVVPLVRCTPRDLVMNPTIVLSYVNFEVQQPEAIFELQSSWGASAVTTNSCTLTVVNGASAGFVSLFSGITYGTHGYATNLLTYESLAKKPA